MSVKAVDWIGGDFYFGWCDCRAEMVEITATEDKVWCLECGRVDYH